MNEKFGWFPETSKKDGEFSFQKIPLPPATPNFHFPYFPTYPITPFDYFPI
jgi:hypothetical protein